MACGTVQSTCVFCGHAFSYPENCKRKRDYCSDKCRRLAHVGRMRERIAAMGDVAKCKVCGKEFKVGRSTAFCSKECRERHIAEVHAAMVARKATKKRHVVCKQCGKEFDTNFMRQSFCSKKCNRDYFNGLRDEENKRIRLERESNPITAKCERCGKEFTYVFNGKDKHFCSVYCCQKAYDDYAKELRRRIREGFKGKTRLCEVCGKTFTLKWRFPNQRCCSSSCRRKLWKHGRKMPNARNATVTAATGLPHELDAYRITKQDEYFRILMTLPDDVQFAEMETWIARDHQNFMDYVSRNGLGSQGSGSSDADDSDDCDSEPGYLPKAIAERGRPFDEENHFK